MEPLLNEVRSCVQYLLYFAWRVEYLQYPVHELRIACILDIKPSSLPAIQGIWEANRAGDHRSMATIDDPRYPCATRAVTTPGSKVDEITIAAKTGSQQLAKMWKCSPIFEQKECGTKSSC